jgi:hypothetical protein
MAALFIHVGGDHGEAQSLRSGFSPCAALMKGIKSRGHWRPRNGPARNRPASRHRNTTAREIIGAQRRAAQAEIAPSGTAWQARHDAARGEEDSASHPAEGAAETGHGWAGLSSATVASCVNIPGAGAASSGTARLPRGAGAAEPCRAPTWRRRADMRRATAAAPITPPITPKAPRRVTCIMLSRQF